MDYLDKPLSRRHNRQAETTPLIDRWRPDCQLFNDGLPPVSGPGGPIFTQVLLADEINRTPPKTQAALSPFLLSHDRVHASRFSAPYFLACCRYIEWSSYQANAHGTPDPLIRNHDLYWRLGRTDLERASAYRELFNTAFDPEFVEALRAATNGGWAMGCEAFKTQIAEALQRRVALLPKGRPPNDDLDDDRQISLLSR